MLGLTQPLPIYLRGFGQDTSTVTPDWITDILNPIADTIKEYYDLQYQQNVIGTQQTLQATAFPNISPIYLIVGGLAVWYLFRGGIKGSEKGQRSKRRKRRAR